jgi:hypothetical protein
VVNALPAAGRVNVLNCTRPSGDPTTLQIGDFTPPFRPNAYKLVVLITDAPPSGFCDADPDVSYDPSVYAAQAHLYALEAQTNQIHINAILVNDFALDPLDVELENEARSVLQDYASTTCGWYPAELSYSSLSDDVEQAILSMLYNENECDSQ